MVDTRHSVRNGFAIGALFPGIAQILAWHQAEGGLWFGAAVFSWFYWGFPGALLLHLASGIRMMFIMARWVRVIEAAGPAEPTASRPPPVRAAPFARRPCLAAVPARRVRG